MISAKNKRRGGVDTREKAASPLGPGSRPCRAAGAVCCLPHRRRSGTPRPGQGEGGGDGEVGERRALGERRGGPKRKEDWCHRSARGSRMGSPRPLCTAAAAARRGQNSRGRAATAPRGDGEGGTTHTEPGDLGPGTHSAPSPGSPRRSHGVRGAPAPPCPHLMLTPVARVCLEARSPGGGGGVVSGRRL